MRPDMRVSSLLPTPSIGPCIYYTIDSQVHGKMEVSRGVPGLFCMLRQFFSYMERLLQCWVNTQQRFRQGNKVTKINSVSLTTESTHKSNIFLYTGGDSMFLYRFVRRRRRRRSQILVHAINFEQLFGFLSFLAQLLALTCRLPD